MKSRLRLCKWAALVFLPMLATGILQKNLLSQEVNVRTQTYIPLISQVGQGNTNQLELKNPGSQVSALGNSINFALELATTPTESVTFLAWGLPEGLTIDPSKGRLSGQAANAGTYDIIILVRDDKDNMDSVTFTWTVIATENRPPTIQQPVSQSTAVGSDALLEVIAEDLDGDKLNYSAQNLPIGLAIDPATGLILGSPSNIGTYFVTITVKEVNDETSSDSATFVWYVTAPNNLPPTLANPGDRSNQIGELINLAVQASDPDGDSITFTAENLPTGTRILTSTGVITGMLTQGGSYRTTITVDDGRGGATSAGLTWQVQQPNNSPPSIQNPGSQESEVGSIVKMGIVATDPDDDALTFSAVGLPPGLEIDENSGEITGIPDTTGGHTVEIMVDDGSGGFAETQFVWEITVGNPPNNPPTLQNPGSQEWGLNQSLSLALNATDPDGDELTFSAFGLPVGLAIEPKTGVISGAANAVGQYSVIAIVEDDRGGQANIQFDWEINQVPVATTVVAISRTSPNTSAFEVTGRDVTMRVERSETDEALSVNIGLMPINDAQRTPVSSDDITIHDADGNLIEGALTFAPQQGVITITIKAKPDEIAEVPEVADLVIQENQNYQIDPEAASARFLVRDDRAVISEDSPLFVAHFGPENGASTTGSGIATVRLSKDNGFGNLSLFFSGLTSEEIASHIHIANPDSGPIAFSIPLGQVTDERWIVKAAHHVQTNQAMLDKLFAGELYANVHSANYPEGEIRGKLLPAQGSIKMQPPPIPDPIAPLTGFELERDIARFLTQATFGPTPESVADLKARVAAHNGDRISAYSEWIDDQFVLNSPSLFEYHQAANALYTKDAVSEVAGHNAYGLTEGWFAASVYSKSQLRERVGFALSEVFVISIEDNLLRNTPQGSTDYYDMLRSNAFGTFKKLLRDVSLHPAMGVYLSHLRNQAELRNADGEIIASPDENYAREVMQLFSIGLLHLHPDGTLKLDENAAPMRTYDQADITELARVFTGLGLSKRNPDNGETPLIEDNTQFFFNGHSRNTAEYQPAFTHPMKIFEDNGRPTDAGNYVRYHDNGEKFVLGVDIPAGLTGVQDLDRALNILTNHTNTAPFISKRLIQRLVSSNPSRGYVYRVASVFESTNGNLGEVVRAILLDPEARNLADNNQVGYGKKKEPLVHFAAMLRLIDAQSAVSDTFALNGLVTYGLPRVEVRRYEADAKPLIVSWNRIGGAASDVNFSQAPLAAPTVFNWFMPDYSPPGQISGAGLVAPELQIITENQIVRYYNVFYRLLIGNSLNFGRPKSDEPLAIISYDQPAWLVEPYMSIMDSNGDGTISSDDAAFGDVSKVKEASLAMVNRLDLYLCSGRLQSQTFRNSSVDPRLIIADSVYDALNHRDGINEVNALVARDERIKEALFLVGTAPECLVER